MIEQLFPISIKPGLFLGRTEKESAGRWIDGNLVSFRGPEGTIRPIEQGTAMSRTGAVLAGVVQSIFAWSDITVFESGSPKALLLTNDAAGSFNSHLYLVKFLSADTITLTNKTPASPFVQQGQMSGAVSADGSEVYFTFVGSGDNPLYKYDVAAETTPTPIGNYTAEYFGSRGVAITPENFLVSIPSRGNSVAWASQGTVSVWAPASTNSAGFLPFPDDGEALRVIVVGSETLVLTRESAWALEYLGGDLIYGLRKIGPGADLYGAMSVAVVNNTAYWMGRQGFYQYDGYVRDLPASDIASYVFDDLHDPSITGHRVFTSVHQDRKEIWWHYAVGHDSTVRASRIVIYNYENGSWSKADTFDAVAGAPIENASFSDASHSVYLFFDAANAATAFRGQGAPRSGSFVESGLLPLGDGSRTYNIHKIIHDRDTTSSADTVTLFRRLDFQGDEASTSVFTQSTPSDVRLKGRYIRYKHAFGSPGTGTMGIPTLGILASSSR